MLTIVARIEEKADRVEPAKIELRALVEPMRGGRMQPVRPAPGVRRPGGLPLLESGEHWETRELSRAHTQSAFLVAFRHATDSARQGIVVNEMTRA